MLTKYNTISVIVPCFKQANYLYEALNSVLQQNYIDWECIIVNDGSPDNTHDVAKFFCDLDKRFKYIFQDNSGLAAARNKGICLSSGQIIFPLDSDDKIHPNYFYEAIKIFNRDDTVGIVYCSADFFGDKNEKWNLVNYSIERMLLQNIIYSSGFFKRDDYNKTVGYNKEMVYGWEDWDFWLSLIENGVKIYKIEETYFYYRVKINSMSKNMTVEQKNFLHKKIYCNHHSLYDKIFCNPFQLFWDKEYYKNSLEYKLGYFLLYPYKKFKTLLKIK